jgi:hypothetical protein
MQALVIQSYRTTDVPEWIEHCLASVRDWAGMAGWHYRFLGDEILDHVPAWYRARAQERMPVMTDLARLIVAREELRSGIDVVAWIDADVLIFDPDGFNPVPSGTAAFSRELWVQEDGMPGRPKAFRNVNNAVCAFRTGNPILDFYIHACESVMRRVVGGVPNQIVGTKMLTALHNIVGFELFDDIGMISPPVARDVVAGTGPALRLLLNETQLPLQAVNLCNSLVGQRVSGVDVDEALLAAVISRLAIDGKSIFAERDPNR